MTNNAPFSKHQTIGLIFRSIFLRLRFTSSAICDTKSFVRNSSRKSFFFLSFFYETIGKKDFCATFPHFWWVEIFHWNKEEIYTIANRSKMPSTKPSELNTNICSRRNTVAGFP